MWGEESVLGADEFNYLIEYSDLVQASLVKWSEVKFEVKWIEVKWSEVWSRVKWALQWNGWHVREKVNLPCWAELHEMKYCNLGNAGMLINCMTLQQGIWRRSKSLIKRLDKNSRNSITKLTTYNGTHNLALLIFFDACDLLRLDLRRTCGGVGRWAPSTHPHTKARIFVLCRLSGGFVSRGRRTCRILQRLVVWTLREDVASNCGS
jgi:hypothetical protein